MPSHILNDTDKSSQSIFLHSNDAVVSISDAEKIFYLNEAIVAPSGYRIVIGLTNLTMPNSMFNVTKNNNIVINGNTWDIPEGNYTAEDLATAINEATSSSEDTINCEFDPTNNNYTFTFDPAGIINSTTLERQLGLGRSDNQLQLPTVSATSYETKNICDLGGTTNIYIRIRNLTMNNIDSRGQTTNIIASIVNNTNFGGYIFYIPPEVLYYQITEQSISHLDIELTDQEGRLIELNGADFNLTITVHYVKQRESFIKNSLLKQIKDFNNPQIKEEENKK
jgi:hypothetical protein